MDLSAPYNNKTQPSKKELFNKQLCSLSYVKLDDAFKIIVQCSQGALVCNTDTSDAFKLNP